MAARSFVIQLQPGVGQALLPDHRKMLPGIQYVVDAETFSKISLGARQSVIKVVSVNLDDTGSANAATASGTYLLAQSSSGVNLMAAPGRLRDTKSLSKPACCSGPNSPTSVNNPAVFDPDVGNK